MDRVWGQKIKRQLGFCYFRGLFLVLFLQTPLSAAPLDLDEVLRSDSRPTMAEFQAIASLVTGKDRIPLGSQQGRVAPLSWVELMARHGPRLVAAMEFTFPGATWAFLGRDVALWSDLVEAFYLSLGQTDRVVRIAASSGSFSSVTGDPWALVEYLDQHGLSLSGAQNRPPFILVDTVSSGFGAQARTLLASAYHLHRQLGGDPASLLRKLNVFGLIVSTFKGSENSFVGSAELLDSEALRYAAGPLDYFTEHRVITYNDPDEKEWVNEAGYAHHTYAWTDPFGPFRRTEGSGVQPTLSPISGTPEQITQIRETILWYQQQMLRMVSDPAFLNGVKAEASELGYGFPLIRIPIGEPLKSVKDEAWHRIRVEREMGKTEVSFEKLRPITTSDSLLRDLLDVLEPVETSESGPSKNGGVLARTIVKQIAQVRASNSQWQTAPSYVCLYFFPFILEALQRRILSPGDLPRVVSPLLHESEVSHSLLKELSALAQAFPQFAANLESGDWATTPRGNEILGKLRLVMAKPPPCAQSIADE